MRPGEEEQKKRGRREERGAHVPSLSSLRGRMWKRVSVFSSGFLTSYSPSSFFTSPSSNPFSSPICSSYLCTPPPCFPSALISPSSLAGSAFLLLWRRQLLGWRSHSQVFDVCWGWLIHDYCNCSFTVGWAEQKTRASMKDAEEPSCRDKTPKKRM